MNLSGIKNVITSKAGRQILTARKHGPAILFGTGVVGVVATVVLACRATLKLYEVLEEAEETLDQIGSLEHSDYSDFDRQKDTALVYFKTGGKIARMYAPAVIVGAASIAALTGAHIVLNRRNVALTAAYAALDKGFRAYRERVIEQYGEDKDRELRYSAETRALVEETEDGPKIVDVTRVGPDGASVYARWFDDSCSSWQRQPEYNRFFLKCQQNYLNDLLNARGHVFLNEAYDALGLKRSSAGSVVGWVKEGKGDGYIDFGIFEGTNDAIRDFVNGWQPFVLLDFNVDGVIYDKI